MKKLLLSLGIVTLLAGPAFAEETAFTEEIDTPKLGLEVGANLGLSGYGIGFNSSDLKLGVMMPSYMNIGVNIVYNLNNNFYLELNPTFAKIDTFSFKVGDITKLQDELKKLGDDLSNLSSEQIRKKAKNILGTVSVLSVPLTINFKFDSTFSPFLGLGISPTFVLSESKENMGNFIQTFQFLGQAGLALVFEDIRVDLFKLRFIGAYADSGLSGNTTFTAGVTYRF